jgi:hypothetical protein
MDAWQSVHRTTFRIGSGAAVGAVTPAASEHAKEQYIEATAGSAAYGAWQRAQWRSVYPGGTAGGWSVMIVGLPYYDGGQTAISW